MTTQEQPESVAAKAEQEQPLQQSQQSQQPQQPQQPQQSFTREELKAILDAQDAKWTSRLAESEKKAERRYGRVKQALDGTEVLKDLDEDQRAAYLDRAETAKDHLDLLVERHQLSDKQRAILSRARDRTERAEWAETLAQGRAAELKQGGDNIDTRLEELGLKSSSEVTGLFAGGARVPTLPMVTEDNIDKLYLESGVSGEEYQLFLRTGELPKRR